MTREPSRPIYWIQRHPTIGVAIAVIAGVILLTAGFVTASAVAGFPELSDRLAAETVVFAGATFVLAAVAAVLALIAYAQSIRGPQLEISVSLFRSPLGAQANVRRVTASVATTGDGPSERWAWKLPDACLQAFLFNDGDLPARSTRVDFRLTGVQIFPSLPLPGGWSIEDGGGPKGWISLRWKGAADDPIYPWDRRPLPDLDIQAVYVPEGSTRLEIDVVIMAEGAKWTKQEHLYEVLSP